MTNLDRALVAAHRGNIARYRRIPATRLTDIERRFVVHRLAEEQRALRTLLAKQRAGRRRASVPRGDVDPTSLEMAENRSD